MVMVLYIEMETLILNSIIAYLISTKTFDDLLILVECGANVDKIYKKTGLVQSGADFFKL